MRLLLSATYSACLLGVHGLDTSCNRPSPVVNITTNATIPAELPCQTKGDNPIKYEYCYESYVLPGGPKHNCKPCKTNLECDYTEGLTCYTNRANNGEDSGCACSIYFGFQGIDRCEPGAPTNFPEWENTLSVSRYLVIFLSLIQVIFASYGVVKTGLSMRWAAGNKGVAALFKLIKTNSNAQSIFFGFMYCLFKVGEHLGLIFTATKTDPHMVFEHVIKGPFVAITITFGTIAIINVA